MLRSILLALGMSLFFTLHAQSPNDILKVKSSDATYLEHLIKIKIDSVRMNEGLPKLANDSGLYAVSKFHCDYLSKNNKTSHSQLNDTMQTPKKRLTYFGVNEYLTEELVHSIYVHRPVSIKPNPNERIKLKVTFKTYNDVANYFVTQWTLNRKTKDDVINSKFNVIGLAVTINHRNDNIKTVVFLGRPFLKYRFVENKKMFPYSDYQTEEPLNSFNEVQKTVVEERPFKLKVTDASKCKKCDEELAGLALKLNVSSSKIYVTANNIENIEGFSKFISSSKNGFMLETIEYEDYHPGNPAYYKKSTRRNNTYIYNGEISAPKFGTDLSNGFKEEKGAFKSFLASNPKLKTYHEFNLYIIYKGMLCGLKRFTSPVGDAMGLYKELKLDYQFDSSHVHQIKVDTTDIPFSFKERTFEFDKSSFKSQLKKNKNYDTKIIKLTIREPVVNYDLEQPMSFDSVVEGLINVVKKEFPKSEIEVERIVNTERLKEYFLSEKDEEKASFSIDEFRLMLNDSVLVKSYIKELTESWEANLQYVTYHNVLHDLESQYIALITKIDSTEVPTEDDMKLATGIHSEMLMESLRYGEGISLEAAKIPRFRIAAKTIVANQVAYNYNSLGSYSKDTLDYFYVKYLKAIYEGTLAIETDKINFLKFSCNHLGKKPFDGSYRSNNLLADLKSISPSLSDSLRSELQSAYDIKLTYYYSHYVKAAAKFESSIENLKKVYGQGDDETKYKLGLTLAYYNKLDDVNEIINPFIGAGSNAKDMVTLYNKINQEYIDIFGNIPESYYQTLINSYDNLGVQKWCEQFVGEGNISFQMFDYLPLYHKYCDECAPYENPATKVTY